MAGPRQPRAARRMLARMLNKPPRPMQRWELRALGAPVPPAAGVALMHRTEAAAFSHRRFLGTATDGHIASGSPLAVLGSLRVGWDGVVDSLPPPPADISPTDGLADVDTLIAAPHGPTARAEVRAA